MSQGFVECGLYLLLARPGVLHLAVAVRIADGVAHACALALAVGADESVLVLRYCASILGWISFSICRCTACSA